MATPQEDLKFDEAIVLQHAPVPAWWTWSLMAAVFLGAFYLTYFHTGADGRDMVASYQRQDAELTRALLGSYNIDMPQDREHVAMFMADEKWRNYGASIFKIKCQSCHGVGGGGLIGPNLTDNHWKNVAHLEDIVAILNNGAGNGAMPAWKDQLDPREIVILAGYVASLMGTDPPAEKGPDGANVIESWDADLASIPKETPAASPAS